MFTSLSQLLIAQVTSATTVSSNYSIPPVIVFSVPLITSIIGVIIGPYITNYLTKSREKDKSINDQIKIGENSTMELTILKAISELKGEILGVRDELKGEILGVRDELKGEILGVRDELKGEIQGVEKRLEAKIYGLEKILTAEIATNATSIAVLSNTIDERIPKVPYSSRV
jgi:hypothetical protein